MFGIRSTDTIKLFFHVREEYAFGPEKENLPRTRRTRVEMTRSQGGILGWSQDTDQSMLSSPGRTLTVSMTVPAASDSSCLPTALL